MISGKKVIIILSSLVLGGAERQALLLARYLIREQGAKVEVWGFKNPGRTSELCAEYGIPWRIAPWPWSLGNAHHRFAFTLHRLQQWIGLFRFTLALRGARPDVILPYTMFPNVICGLVWHWTGAQLCIWNQRDEGRGRFGPEIERRVVSQMPWFVSNSQHGTEFLVQELGVETSRIFLIHNGIELAQPESDRAMWRDRLAVSDDCFLVCMVANLSIYKDHATLLKAWRKVVNRLSAIDRQAVLLLAGRFDNSYESVKALASELELGQNVQFLERVDDVAGLLGAIDLGIFSSRFEGCPNAVLEYMAAGLAVVGTDSPGIREAVGTEGYEFLAPPADADKLADYILVFERDDRLRAKLGMINRQRIIEEFSLQQMCTQMVEVISIGLSKSI